MGYGYGGGNSGGGGGARPVSRTVPAATTGALCTMARKLGSTSVFSLLSGSNANLSIGSSTGAISATAGISEGASQVAYVREAVAASHLAIEYSATLTAAVIVTAPAAPSLTATAGNGEITLSWTDGSTGGAAITSHKLYRGTASGAETLIGTIMTGSPYVDTGLTNGTTYYYKLSAVNSLGESALSTEQSATPSASPPISSEFPVLKAAYETGQRALISWIGDSTVAYAVPGAHESQSTAGYLRDYLTAAGLPGVIGGCFSAGDKGLISTGVMTLSQYATFYDPDASFTGTFNAPFNIGNTAFGLAHTYTTTAGDKVSYDPGFAFDRAELFYLTFTTAGGAGNIDLKVGATTLLTTNGNQSASYRKTAVQSFTRGTTPIDQVAASGTVWPGAVRCWDSTASHILQVENLGVCTATCAYWLATSGGGAEPGLGAGNTIASLGCHLAIIQLGANEMNNGVSAATYQANLTSLINAFKTAGSDVLVLLPPPATSGWAMDADHRAAVPAACTAAGIGAPVDLYSGVGFDTGTDLYDPVHPNAAGNYKIVNGAAGVGARILGL